MTAPLIDEVEALIEAEPVVSLDGLSREDWLAQRMHGLGGSDASAVVGHNPWVSPFHLYLLKRGEVPDSEVGEAAEWGNRLEEVIATKTAEEFGLTMYKPRWLYRHAEHEWMLGNCDRLAWDPDRGLGVYEGKTAGIYMAEEWGDGPAPHAFFQATHYMEVMGLDWARVSVLIGGQRFESHLIERDKDFATFIIHKEAEFWEAVVTGNPPAPTGLKSDTELLRRRWPESAPDSQVFLPAEAAALAARRRELHATAKKVSTELTRIENQFREWLGDREAGLDPATGDVIFTNKTYRPARVDHDVMRAAGIYELCLRAKPERRISFPAPKDKDKD